MNQEDVVPITVPLDQTSLAREEIIKSLLSSLAAEELKFSRINDEANANLNNLQNASRSLTGNARIATISDLLHMNEHYRKVLQGVVRNLYPIPHTTKQE
ncbi:hypothetical protein EBB07_17395 [Paenibacillaceae bacterium]|nr:hypothetical protein EBB07_17395 [Paenibacillaceae bacterium]